jgi:hypothetical protein
MSVSLDRVTIANALMAVGGGAVLTGMGGRYFLLVDVGPWSGDSMFSTSVPGVWTGPLAGQGTTENTLFSVSGLVGAVWAMTGLQAGDLGFDRFKNVNVYGWPTSTAYDFGKTPGPFGAQGGLVFIGLFAAGLLLRVA